jgi:TolA-binding protein
MTARADLLDEVIDEANSLDEQAAGLGPHYLRGGQFKGDQYVAERLVDGENYYRVKDYQRASIIFMDIIENYSGHAAYPDALFLYADSVFLSEDYVGARAWFREFLDKSGLPGAGRYKEKAIARLIETSIHLNDYEGVDEHVTQLRRFKSDEARYVTGKYRFFRGDFQSAEGLFKSITKPSLTKYKATYMLGVALTQQGKYKEAIEVFLEGGKTKATTRVTQEIVDLMNLGAGRLYYEQGQMAHAAACYQKVGQSSRYFDSALYEGASVLIQAGDTVRADQTLEVLSITVPDSRYLPRAKMLRGNLLLRAGRYDEAEQVFEELVEEFTPLMTQLERVIEEQKDTRKFFFDIVERSISTLDVSTVLPPLVVKWVGEEPEVQRALGVAKDLGAAKGYVRETERLVRLLEAVVEGPSRINAVPMLREGMRRSQQIANRLGQLRVKLSVIADDELKDEVSGLGKLTGERQRLIRETAALPTTREEFRNREHKSREVCSRMRNELSRTAIRLDQLNAMTVAIERLIDYPRYIKGVPKANIQAVSSELRRHRHAILEMQRNLDDIRIDIEKAGYQTGIGDADDKKDAQLNHRARQLAQKERGLFGSRGGKDAERIRTAHKIIDRVERKVIRFQKEVAQEAGRQVKRIRAQVNQERDRIAGYYTELSSLGGEAETVVGGVTFESFSAVRKRFHELVLKADVGIIDVAWLRKEAHTGRISELTSERLKDIKRLGDEFQEVQKESSE